MYEPLWKSESRRSGRSNAASKGVSARGAIWSVRKRNSAGLTKRPVRPGLAPGKSDLPTRRHAEASRPAHPRRSVVNQHISPEKSRVSSARELSAIVDVRDDDDFGPIRA